LKLFEYEAKNILKRYGIAIPRGDTASSPDQAEAIARDIGRPVALKSQVLVSGRGKAGGILFAGNADEAGHLAAGLLNTTIKGSRVSSLLVEERLELVREFYASVTIDRRARTYLVLASTSGGADIEEVARTSPDKVSRHWVDPTVGFSRQDAIGVLGKFSLSEEESAGFASIIDTLYRVATDGDAELVEINPLASTPSGELVAADARIIVDDNALFRHPEFEDSSAHGEDETPGEAEARQQGLAYVDLDGDIGIIGNGAGLVMSTIDLVQLYGGRPGNFLDIGGGARSEVIEKAVALVMSKPGIRAVLINILGGITRCDIVARGVIAGIGESGRKKPIAIRMMGTNEEEGVQILRQAGINTCPSMEEAVVEVLKL